MKLHQVTSWPILSIFSSGSPGPQVKVFHITFHLRALSRGLNLGLLCAKYMLYRNAMVSMLELPPSLLLTSTDWEGERATRKLMARWEGGGRQVSAIRPHLQWEQQSSSQRPPHKPLPTCRCCGIRSAERVERCVKAQGNQQPL